ncbi:MAG: BrnA antitoxin family protein [Solobacterium sp.]|jgi:predicted DNA binding CopG/RHH family protein|nr:BrnA antitoxin family protein [Solobacterium sp.]
MRKEYNIKELNPRKNPYAKQLKKSVTIKLKPTTIEYFKNKSGETGIPYQTLINMYLDDCATKNKELEINWR